MILLSTALAGLDPSVAVFAGGHVAERQHELYETPGFVHQPLGPSLALGLRFGLNLVSRLHAEAEVLGGPVAQVQGFLYGWRGQAMLDVGLNQKDRLTPMVLVGFGNLGLISRALGHDLDVALHFGPALEIDLGKNVHLRGDLRWLLSGRKGASTFPGSHAEVLIGLGWRSKRKDRDGDGILDRQDNCPDTPETINLHRDEDGCPDVLADLKITVRDAEGGSLAGVAVQNDEALLGTTDEAGVLRIEGLMPGTPLVLTADTDVLEPAKLQLTLVEGPNRGGLVLGWPAGTLIVHAENAQGRPIQAEVRAIGATMREWSLNGEGEAQEVLPAGNWRILVSAPDHEPAMQEVALPPTPGVRTRVDVVLLHEKVQVQANQIVILHPIQFERNSHLVLPSSMDVVQAVANALAENPDILRIEVAGHASEEGNDRHNQALSQARVDEVVRLLVERGIAPERLTAKGYGSSKPIAPNDTEAGRILNRRVEFDILERGATP